VAHGKLIVGIDAGATATKGILLARDGRTEYTVEERGFNLRTANVLKFRDLAVGLIRELFHKADLIGHLPDAIAVGVAGAGTEEERKMLRDTLASRFPNLLVLVHHDAFIAHYGAFRGEPGVLVTSGTGSIAFGKNEQGVEARAGGWGWMLGDEGSGWWVGREALRAALAEWEGSGPKTAITPMILDALDVETAYDVVPQLYADRIHRSDIAALARDVAQLALEEKDEVATRILHVAGRQLGNLAVRAAHVLRIPPEELTVALLGSLALGGGKLIESGVLEVLSEYKETLAEPDAAAEQVDEDPGVVKMPAYPPTDLTMESSNGPRLITAQDDAVHGALLWAGDNVLKRRFA